jgi:hypothetical protein
MKAKSLPRLTGYERVLQLEHYEGANSQVRAEVKSHPKKPTLMAFLTLNA